MTQRSAAATCAVQFPTPVSVNSLPTLAPNIDNPQWQHASVLPTAAVSVNNSALLVANLIGQTHGQYGQLQAINNSSTGHQPAQPASVTVEQGNSATSPPSCVLLHGKRKMSNGYDSACPSKVFVNEDRMSARLHDLHLDNNNLDWHPDLEQEPWYSRRLIDEGQSSSASTTSSVDQQPQQTIELCQDLQLSLRTKQLLPKVIIDELNKPSLQIVLWKPPGDFVRDLVSTSHSTSYDQQPRACDDDDDDDDDVMTDDSVTSRSLTEQRVTSLVTDDDMDL